MASRSIRATLTSAKTCKHEGSAVFSSSLSADAAVDNTICLGGPITFSDFKAWGKSYYFVIYIDGVEACETREITDQDSSDYHTLTTYIDTDASMNSNALLTGSGEIEVLVIDNTSPYTDDVCKFDRGCTVTIEANYSTDSGEDGGEGDGDEGEGTTPSVKYDPYPPATVNIAPIHSRTGDHTLSWSESIPGGESDPVSSYQIQYQISESIDFWPTNWTNYDLSVQNKLTANVRSNLFDVWDFCRYRVVAQSKGGGYSYNRDPDAAISQPVAWVGNDVCVPPDVIELSKNTTSPRGVVTLSWSGAQSGLSLSDGSANQNQIIGYDIYRSSAEYGAVELIDTVSTSETYGSVDVTAPETIGESYYYRIYTIGSLDPNDDNLSKSRSWLSESYVVLTAKEPAPDKPKSVTVGGKTEAYAKTGETVLLSWVAPDQTTALVVGYDVYQNGVYLDTTTDTSMDVPANKSNGGVYAYTVKAKGEFADSEASGSVMVYTYSDPEAPRTIQVNGKNSVVAGTSETITLTWSGAAQGAYNPIKKYRVCLNGEAIAETANTSIVATSDSSVGVTQEYTVVTVGERSESEQSAPAFVYTYEPVTAPTDISVSSFAPDARTAVDLSWSGAKAGVYNAITGYKIYESIGQIESYVLIAQIESGETNGTYTVIAPDSAGTTCRYKISTVGVYGESGASDVYAEYTTKSFGLCKPPTSVIISQNNAAAGDVANLYWSGAQDGENSRIIAYAVYQSTSASSGYVKILETDQTYADVSASDVEGQIYYFKVQAIAEDPNYSSDLSGAYAWLRTNVTTSEGGNSVPASGAFHAAIRNGAKQRALVYFYEDGLWLTNDDIVSDGISYANYFCSEEDLTIGLTPCATVSFSIFNENHRLDHMRFGRFRASLGAMTSSGEYTHRGNVTAVYDGDEISGHDEYPYVRVNQIGLLDQPDFAVKSIFAMDDRVYCIGENEKFIVYSRNLDTTRNDVQQYIWQYVATMTWAQLRDIVWGEDTRFTKDHSAYINALMLAVSERYARRNVGIVVESDHLITDYLSDGRFETYTYIDLGIFNADKPARTKTNVISVEGYDNMSRFDKSTEDMKIEFPITLYSLLDTLCAFVGVEHKIKAFSNRDITLTENSDIFQSTTARDVLGYIAEAACANAKIDYDGKLVFAWWSDTDLTLNESDYAEFVPYEYVVKQIDRLQIRNSDTDIGILVGGGTNGYVIQENPFLIFDSDEAGQAAASSIYANLASFAEYTPGSVEWLTADWSYRPGDVITVSYGGVSYRYPVFGYTLKWTGKAKITLESTGSEYREVISAKNREAYAYGRKMLEISKSIDGVRVIASEAKQTSEGTSEKVSKFEQDVEGFVLRVEKVEKNKVSKNEIISEINLSTEEAKITAPHISLEGVTTINDNFKVLKDGSVEAKNGKFDGVVTAGNWTFDEGGYEFDDGSSSVNMTVMNGNFVGGGSGNRAFFGSSGIDVQYGSDYNRTTYIRSGNIVIVAQNPEEMSEYGTVKFIRSASGQASIVCGESKGASTTDMNSKGNLGMSTQYWDYTFTRVLRAGTYPGSSSRAIKQDIEELPEMGDLLDRLVPVSFAYKNDPKKPRYGLIYEDTKEVMPVVCFDDGQGDPGIVYTDLIAPMLKEIQSLRKRIKALEERM